MAEYLHQPDCQQPELPRHRVTLLLGTLGLAELKPGTMEALPWEADFAGMLGNDELRVTADELTDNYFVDWITYSQLAETAVVSTLRRTVAIMGSAGINPDTIAIKGAYATSDEDLFDRFPHIARPDMDDMTETAQNTTRY